MPKFIVQGKNINYRVLGEGKPLLILNGIMMSTMSWGAFEGQFSRNNQLILVDLLDQGQSDKMEGDFSQALQVEVVKALCDELKLTKLNLLGTSYGGEVALQFVIRYPAYVERLMLFNTVAHTNAWLKEIGDGWNKAAYDPEAYYSTTIPVIYSPAFYDRKKDWMNRRKEVLTKGAFANAAFLGSMVRLTNSAASYDVREFLNQITVPTLIVGCENDHITPSEEQRYLHRHIQNSSLVMVPETGHAMFYERPWLFATLVMGFVNLESTSIEIV